MELPKDYLEFEMCLGLNEPPKNWTEGSKALWFAANNDLEKAHSIAQDLDTEIGSLIHAYLHRVEGDKFNAGYWYSQANKPYSKLSFNEELKEIVRLALAN